MWLLLKQLSCSFHQKFDEMQPTSTEVDSLNSFLFVDDEMIRNLKTEMSLYMATCEGVCPNYDVLKW